MRNQNGQRYLEKVKGHELPTTNYGLSTTNYKEIIPSISSTER